VPWTGLTLNNGVQIRANSSKLYLVKLFNSSNILICLSVYFLVYSDKYFFLKPLSHLNFWKFSIYPYLGLNFFQINISCSFKRMITFFKAVHVCIEKWSTQGFFLLQRITINYHKFSLISFYGMTI